MFLEQEQQKERGLEYFCSRKKENLHKTISSINYFLRDL
jgi:hypothetical protein